MSIDAHQAAALIASHANRKLQSKSGSIQNVQTEFCTIWAEARPVLTLVEELLGFIPVAGTGTTAGGVLAGLIAVGNQISQQVCPAPTAKP